MRVLVVEDDTGIRRLVSSRLAQQGLEVTPASTAAEGLRALRHVTFDVAILDLALPDGSGLDLVQALRDLGADTHVIILTGAGSEEDRVRALELGADDYVVKPFFVRELSARVLAVQRRRDLAKDSTLTHGPLEVDLAARCVTVDGAPVELTAKEFDLLAFLAARPGHAFSRDDLLRSVWQSAADWQRPSTVTEHIRRLRSKIEPGSRPPRLLVTVRGTGYRFEPPAGADATSLTPAASAAAAEAEAGVLVTVRGRIVAADAHALSLVGLSSESQMVGRDVLEFVAPVSLTAARLRREATTAGVSPSSQVLAVQRADGVETMLEVSSERTQWQGELARRITIRPSTDPPSRLRQVVTGVLSEVSDAVIVTDLHLHVRSWNHAAERLYGWTEEEVLGRHMFDVVPFAEDSEELRSALLTLEEQGRWFGYARQVARDGSIVVVSVSTTLLRDLGGEPVLVVSVNRPTSEPVTSGAPEPPDPALADELRRGIEAGELEVHYQPVTSLDDGRVVSVEALVRWNHPRRGLLAPDSFIGDAERNGMIVELGRVVFELAFAQAVAWRQAGFALDVAVNLSARQLTDPDLFAQVMGSLDASGLDPHALWLEVTETALVEDLDQAADVLHRLAGTGVRVAIDDFGTGWASLTYLKQFPVHALKIDRSFIDGIEHSSQCAAIARSIVSLGQELDLLVIAEGVETRAQRDALQALGCSLAQGFLFGRPTPAAGVATDRAGRLPG